MSSMPTLVLVPPTNAPTTGMETLPAKDATCSATAFMSTVSKGASRTATQDTLGSSMTVLMANSYLAAVASPRTSTGL